MSLPTTWAYDQGGTYTPAVEPAPIFDPSPPPPGQIGGSYDWWWQNFGHPAGMPYQPPAPQFGLIGYDWYDQSQDRQWRGDLSFGAWWNPATWGQPTDDRPPGIASAQARPPRSLQEAHFVLADFFDRAGRDALRDGNPVLSSNLHSSAATYRGAAPSKSDEQTKVAIGEVAWDRSASHDRIIYEQMMSLYRDGVSRFDQFGARGWAEALNSEIDGLGGRVQRLREITWEQAARDTVPEVKKKLKWYATIGIPTLLFAGAVALLVYLTPMLTALAQGWSAGKTSQ